jgi:hypothetical protein
MSPQKKRHPLPFKCVACKKKNSNFELLVGKKFDRFMMTSDEIFSLHSLRRSSDKKGNEREKKVEIDSFWEFGG